MPDIKRVDPTLSTTQDADQKSDFDQLRLRKVALELSPERIIRLSRIPRDRVCIAQRRALTVGEERRLCVVVDLRELVLANGLLSRPDRSLDRSILTVESRRDAQPQ